MKLTVTDLNKRICATCAFFPSERRELALVSGKKVLKVEAGQVRCTFVKNKYAYPFDGTASRCDQYQEW